MERRARFASLRGIGVNVSVPRPCLAASPPSESSAPPPGEPGATVCAGRQLIAWEGGGRGACGGGAEGGGRRRGGHRYGSSGEGTCGRTRASHVFLARGHELAALGVLLLALLLDCC